MTLEEEIKYSERIAEKQENIAQFWHERKENNIAGFRNITIQKENECKGCVEERRQIAEWLKDYRRLKEQETCEDAVSRKDIYFKLTNGAYPNETIEQFIDRLVKELKALPPVTPQHTNVEIQKMQEMEQDEIQKAYELGKEDNIKAMDKIRAEIWDLQYGNEEKSMTDEDRVDAYNNAIRQVIEIIDKYKAESEDKV